MTGGSLLFWFENRTANLSKCVIGEWSTTVIGCVLGFSGNLQVLTFVMPSPESRLPIARKASKKRLIQAALVAVLTAFALLGLWKCVSTNEPSYQGRTLSSWVGDLNSGESDAHVPVHVALRAMGTNAILRLVDDIVKRDPGWRRSLRRQFSGTHCTWLQDSPAQATRSRAAKALRALDADAAPALPLLIGEVRKGKGQSGLPWVGLSAIVHGVPESIPTIIRELNTSMYRAQVARFLGVYATHAEVSIPFLMQCAEDQDWRTRYYALGGLERFGNQASSAEPIVRNLLEDTNTFVAHAAAKTLESICLSNTLAGQEATPSP